jgi:hypothetical protein
MLDRPNFQEHTSTEEAPAELTPIQLIQKDRNQIQFDQFGFGLTESRFKIQTLCIWGALQFDFSANIYLMINIIQSQALASPPFNLTPAGVGYTNLELFVGASFSLVTAGPLSDVISERATVRNGGIREPEMRLPALLPLRFVGLWGVWLLRLGFGRGGVGR